ncbi:MAG: HmuY family protein [Chitinophagaceae bacterium]|jgi:hypothetical protein
MKKIKFIAVLLASWLMLHACLKSETSIPQKTLIEKYAEVDADSTVFMYFSFEQNDTIQLKDSSTQLWDVAFKDSLILTNSGVSGPGKGGGLVFKGIYDDIPCFPDSVTVDIDSTKAPAIDTTWYEYDPVAKLVKLIPARVMLIRTGTGKYAKMEVLKYYKEENGKKLRAQYTFRYAYQSAGTRPLTDSSICK